VTTNTQRTCLCGALASLALLLWSPTATAVPTHEEQVPHGKAFGCVTCHVQEEDPALHEFGLDFQDNAARWDPALAERDSDGDGASNGVELGDPDGEWAPGEPAPELTPTNPGDPNSTPPPDVPDDAGGCSVAQRRKSASKGWPGSAPASAGLVVGLLLTWWMLARRGDAARRRNER